MAQVDPTLVQSFLSRYGLSSLWNPSDPLLLDGTYEQLAGRQMTNKMPRGFLEETIANEIARVVLYDHKTPGDCGSPAQYSSGVGASASKFASLGAATAGTGLSTAAAAGGLAASTAVEAASIVGLAVLPFTVWGIFSAHHAAAVAREQSVLCAATVQVNASFQQIDQAVQSNSLPVSTALTQLDQLENSADSYIAQVRKDCNAGCIISRRIHCLVDLRKLLYRTQGQSAAAGLTKSNLVAYAGLAALAAKFTGVF